MIKAVVFDLDGTLLNTIKDLQEAVNYSVSKYGYEKITYDQAKNYIGNGIRKLIERSLNGNLDKINEVFEEFKEYYFNNCNNYTKPYDGILEVINYLKNNNFKLAVVSNKNVHSLNFLVKEHFKDSFPIVIGDGEGIKRKPAPDALIECAKRLNVNVEEIVYIGDSDVDVITDKNTG